MPKNILYHSSVTFSLCHLISKYLEHVCFNSMFNFFFPELYPSPVPSNPLWFITHSTAFSIALSVFFVFHPSITSPWLGALRLRQCPGFRAGSADHDWLPVLRLPSWSRCCRTSCAQPFRIDCWLWLRLPPGSSYNPRPKGSCDTLCVCVCVEE